MMAWRRSAIIEFGVMWLVCTGDGSWFGGEVLLLGGGGDRWRVVG